MATLLILNNHMERKRDDIAWNLEKLVVELKRMAASDCLHVQLQDFIALLKRHKPARFLQRPCAMWIGHDAYENNILYDNYQQVSLDFSRAITELERIYEDSKWIHDKRFIYQQVEWLIDNVLDKSYYWE